MMTYVTIALGTKEEDRVRIITERRRERDWENEKQRDEESEME